MKKRGALSRYVPDVESGYGKILKQHKLPMTDVDLGQREAEINDTF